MGRREWWKLRERDRTQRVGRDRRPRPGFDQTNWVSWAEGVHFAMVTAFTTGEPQHVRPFVNDSLYERLAAQITAMTADQRRRVDSSDPHAVIVHAHTDASVDTIVVKVDGSVGLPDGGSGPSRWTFQRSSQATTPAGGLSAAPAPTCASCGAPLKLDPSGECAFCRTPFSSGRTAGHSSRSWRRSRQGRRSSPGPRRGVRRPSRRLE